MNKKDKGLTINDELNFPLYKEGYEDLIKLRKKLVRLLSSEDLIDELKRRGSHKFDWIGNKYKEQLNTETMRKANNG